MSKLFTYNIYIFTIGWNNGDFLSVEVSPKVKLPHPEMLMYKLQLIQDLQASIGWFYDPALIFTIDDVTKRGVKIKFYGTPSSIPAIKDRT